MLLKGALETQPLVPQMVSYLLQLFVEFQLEFVMFKKLAMEMHLVVPLISSKTQALSVEMPMEFVT